MVARLAMVVLILLTAGSACAESLNPDAAQVERMNRTLKEATVRRYHYDSHHQVRQHMQIFLDAYNFAQRLKPRDA